MGIDRGVQNAVDIETYGMYFTLLNLSFMFNIFLDLGLNHFNNREISQRPEQLQKYFSVIALLKLCLGAGFLVFTNTIGRFVLHYSDFYLYLLALIGINQILLSFLLFLRSNLAGLQHFRIDSAISVLDRTIVVVVCGVLLWGGVTKEEFKIEWFALAQTFAYGITILVALMALLSKVKITKPAFDLPFIGKLIRSSFPFALLNVIMMIYFKMDAVMLEQMLPDGAKQTGIYAQGYKLPEAATMVALLFATLLYPMFSRMLANKENITGLLLLASRVMIAPALVGVVALSFYAEEFMDLLYKKETWASAQVLPYLMFTFLAIAMGNIYGTLLTSNGNLKQMNIISFGGLVLNIVLNLILIPNYKAEGSAIATVITHWSVIFTQLFLIKLIFNFKINYSLIFRFAFFLLFLVGIGLISKYFQWSLFVGIATFAAVGGGVSILIGLIKPKELYQFAKGNV